MSQQDRNEVLETLKELRAEITERIERRANLIDGTPFVVECCDGLYLKGADAEGQCYADGITANGIVCYSEQDARTRAKEAREVGGAWAHARAVHINEALHTERAKLSQFISLINRKAA